MALTACPDKKNVFLKNATTTTKNNFRFYDRGYISQMCTHKGKGYIYKGYEVVPLIQLYNKPIEEKKDEMRERQGDQEGRVRPKKFLPQHLFIYFFLFFGFPPFFLRSTWGLYTACTSQQGSN